MSKTKFRTIDEYEIRNFQFTTDYVAVFANLDDSGKTVLNPEPLEAIGVAKWTQYTLAEGERLRDIDKTDSSSYSVENAIVGLYRDLEHGFWEIANEASNYVGMFKTTDDLSKVKVPLRIEQFLDTWRKPETQEATP